MKKIIVVLCLLVGMVGSASAQKKEVVTLTVEIVSLRGTVDSLRAVCAQNNATMQQQMALMGQLMTVMQQMIVANSELGKDCRAMKEEYAGLQKSMESLATSMSMKNYEIKQDYATCGRTLVRQGVLYGYVDNSGKMVIPAEYDDGCYFAANATCVRKGDKWGLIDVDGNILVPMKYLDIVYRNESGIIPVEENGKWGAIDRKGKVVIPFKFSDVRYSSCWKFYQGDTSYKYDHNGNLL